MALGIAGGKSSFQIPWQAAGITQSPVQARASGRALQLLRGLLPVAGLRQTEREFVSGSEGAVGRLATPACTALTILIIVGSWDSFERFEGYNFTCGDCEESFIPLIFRMDMKWRVVTVVHADVDAKEGGDDGHETEFTSFTFHLHPPSDCLPLRPSVVDVTMAGGVSFRMVWLATFASVAASTLFLAVSIRRGDEISSRTSHDWSTRGARSTGNLPSVYGTSRAFTSTGSRACRWCSTTFIGPDRS